MKRMLISVEGQTEDAFVTTVLQPHFMRLGGWLQPVIVETKHVAGHKAHKGGLSSWAKAERDIRRLLGDSSAIAITTMYDLYAFPADSPGMAAGAGIANPADRVLALEDAIRTELGDHRFVPHLSLFELEALVLATPPAALEERAAASGADLSPLRALPEPEQVNDENPPSKRILACWPGYAKPVDGPSIVAEAGLDTVRQVCPHFDQWLTRLEEILGEAA